MNKQYLGDGVYIEYEYGYGFILTTENGIESTNRIVLEPEVYINFVRYVSSTINREDSENIEQ